MEPALPLAGLNILVVDDDEDSRFYITTVLEADGASVMAVASARVALKVLPELQSDVLICDIAMPDEDGYTFIRKIRALKPDIWGKLPAIALTAYGDSEYRSLALEAGFQTHVAKPVDPGELVAIVANLMLNMKVVNLNPPLSDSCLISE
ncbi:response regulator [Nostoc sp.]|uniref:response regulator n=1 Tax=Nostoc sp. TaxID=1180 RepID=UPI002FF5A6DA